MEEYTQITLTEWLSWKEDIRQKLQETAGNFVHIGYRLKQIRDSGMFDGCQDIFTVKEIRELKEFNRQGVPEEELEEAVATSQQNPGDIVNTKAEAEPGEAEEPARQQEPERDAKAESRVSYTPLQRCIIDFFSDSTKRETLCQIMDILTGELTEDKLKTAAEAANPGEYCTHKKGLVFLFMYDWNQGVKYKLMTAPEPVSMTWQEFLREIQDVYLQAYEKNPEDVWSEFYGKKEGTATEKPEPVTEDGEINGTEERTGNPEGAGEEPERQQDAGSQEAKTAPEGEADQEGDGGPAEEPESCCDVATETPSAIVNTEAEADPETEEYCQDCRFAHPESQAKRIAYASVCEECTEGSNYQPGKAPEEEQEEEALASELERQLREQVIDLTEELRSRVRLTVNPRPLEMVEARSVHAAARKIMALVDRIMDIKESEQEELEGQMSIEDWENES